MPETPHHKRTYIPLGLGDVLAIDHRDPLTEEQRVRLEQLGQRIRDVSLTALVRRIQIGPISNIEPTGGKA